MSAIIIAAATISKYIAGQRLDHHPKSEVFMQLNLLERLIRLRSSLSALAGRTRASDNAIIPEVFDASLYSLLTDGIQTDAGGRVRVSQFTTLGDYKMLNYDHVLLMENAGTGTGTFSGNKYNMAVAAGQWLIKTSRRPHQYFSGKSQVIEATFDNFHPEEGITKRIGYFSSSSVSPFSETLDGFWVESSGGTLRLKASRAGVETLNIELSDWNGCKFLNSYQSPAAWKNFTVVLFDFLWLGGAILRLWVKTQYGFILAHSFHYSGTSEDIFILTPNQPLRYEIRSSSGAGSMRYICAQVSTEGSTNESGMSRAVDTGATAIVVASIGVTYPVKAVRKGTSFRDTVVKIDEVNILLGSNNDNVLWTLQVNPTLSTSLTYTPVANSGIEEANGNGTITVTGVGTTIASGYMTQGGIFPSRVLRDNFLSYLAGTLDNVQDQYVLCLTPITATISSFSSITVKEY